MFNQEEIKQLQALFNRFTRTIELSLYKSKGNPFSRNIEDLVSELCEISEGKCIAISVRPDPTPVAVPCFKIGAGGHANIVYAALPTGHEFTPFLKILERIGCGDYEIPNDALLPNSVPAELIVLISESCPRCPLVVEAAGMIACGNPNIVSSFINVMHFQEFVLKYKIMSVPATILDGEVVATGTVSTDKLMELVRNRGTAEFEMETVRSLIETQQIAKAARRLDSEAGRAVVLELMQDAEFSKRLSALVVVEQALEDNPDSVRAMVPVLLPMLKHKDSRIRGDVADLLGKIGDTRAIPELEKLLSDPDPDVVEATEDALAELRKN